MRAVTVRILRADRAAVTLAARMLAEGKLVAFPTETVYGLGADAGNVAAVERIFEAKRRPADHPLIVHVPDLPSAKRWATLPPQAIALAKAFWPGPLTLIAPRAAHVHDIVTGSQSSVGLRVPSHPVAHALLQEFGNGIAAPSANRFGHVSPTLARHVADDLGDAVDLILDGGGCAIGIESTIVAFASGSDAAATGRHRCRRDRRRARCAARHADATAPRVGNAGVALRAAHARTTGRTTCCAQSSHNLKDATSVAVLARRAA
jgi:L-threonylcarbamoyladenylate synthase